ncbi:MAG: hypothetical protein EAZ91_20460 [Cytophagales bacterium]|nr:MAG: hypothetical protein EAZ91_20460 [Cytophagales bacterium]
MRYLLPFLFLFLVNQANAQAQSKIPIIFDTDIGPDYDDIGAITMLHAFSDSGRVNILATVASCAYPRVAPVLSVMNTYFGRPDIPIGVPKGKAVTDADVQHWSDTLVARYPHTIRSNNEAPDAVQVYRRVLAAQPDGSVTIVTVGFLTNLANLLQTKGDQYSKLNGRELVARKVKQLVSMAGKFPTGDEYNVYKDAVASKVVFGEWPTPVLLSGFEIGEKIKSGIPLIQNGGIRHSPAQDVFRISIPLDKNDKDGRMSWDQTAVLVAVYGPEPYYNTVSGRLTITDDKGTNGWDATKTGHRYLVQKAPVGEVAGIINHLMMHQPRTATPPPGAGHEFLMTSVRTGDTEVFATDPETGTARNLTRSPFTDERYASWSPDGKQVTFTSNRTPDGAFNVFVMDADGSNVRQITFEKAPAVCYYPVFTGDGKTIVFSLANDAVGKAIAARVPANGGPVREIADARDAHVSPDGQRVVFTLKKGNNFPVFVVNIDGTNLQQLTTPDQPNDLGAVGPVFSPDGKQIAYVNQVGQGAAAALELFVMDSDGKNSRQITRLGQMSTSPAWSPDGRSLSFRLTDNAFWRDATLREKTYLEKRADKRPVYVVPVDGSSAPEVVEPLRYQCGIDGSRANWWKK